ncbi:hypothetical protein C8Q75DRAFT_737585 [Abortiporus biennis]|nr:hypothetical protein C8Q75DRAFT_737585 [Abortiporus biennis]
MSLFKLIYRQTSVLAHYKRAAHNVSISKNEQVVACRDVKGVCFYDLSTYKELEGPETVVGRIVFWRQEGQEIIGSQNGVIAVYTFDDTTNFNLVFVVLVPDTIPKALSFINNPSKDVHVFGLNNEKKVLLRGDNGFLISNKDLGTFMSASIIMKYNIVIIDNVDGSLDLHHLNSGKCIRTFLTEQVRKHVLRQIAFIENGKFVISGSDCGVIYIFDRKTGSKEQVLCHSANKNDLVQTIVVQEIKDVNIIVSASSNQTIWYITVNVIRLIEAHLDELTRVRREYEAFRALSTKVKNGFRETREGFKAILVWDKPRKKVNGVLQYI